MEIGDNDALLEELEQLFNEDEQETPPATDNSAQTSKQSTTSNVENTQAFAKRLREKTEKAVAEERERLAKQLGYTSYDELQQKQEQKLLEDKGLDPEEISPIVNELVKKRLNEDPRMQELAALQKKQQEEFAKRELSELSKLVGTDFTDLSQVPQDVLDLWKTNGSLKKSYMMLHGEELVTKARSEAVKGTTSHLQSPSGQTPPPSDMRHLTDEERQVWKLFHPNMTDDELNNKMVKK